jgi:acetyl-CoA acyltransferase
LRRKGDTVVDIDEHPRPDTTAEQLAKLKAPFREGGSVTAGNASGVNDGAAAMIIASEKPRRSMVSTPIARIVGGATAGVAAAHHGHRPGASDAQAVRTPRHQAGRL